MLSLIIVLLGLAAYDRLTVREYPNIDPPVVTVRTSYPGANARIVETQVTQVLEDSLAGIEGIDYISSTSRQGTSFVNIRFTLDRDPDVAALLRLSGKGRIETGADADLVALDGDNAVADVFAGGAAHVRDGTLVRRGTFENTAN